MKIFFTLFFWALIFPILLVAQNTQLHENTNGHYRCSHEALMESAISQNPDLTQTIRSNNKAITKWIEQDNLIQLTGGKSGINLITIPVVFHLVYQEGDVIPAKKRAALLKGGQING